MKTLYSFLCLISLATCSCISGQAPPGYYDTVDSATGASLRSTLHEVIDDHLRFPYTSSATDTWNILELADEDPGDPNRILDVYKNASYGKIGGGTGSYNREHSWPKSYGFPKDGSTNYPYTDCHALFLCDSGYNSSRSNKPYRDCSSTCLEKVTDVNAGMGGGSGVYPGNSSWTSGSGASGSWETWGQRRGDVARALFYLDVRYEGGVHAGTGVSEPDLILTDIESLIAASNTGSNESVAYMGMLSVLLSWHIADPVDALELSRNERVFEHQGNRNPFIDHPEWIDCIFTDTCGGSGGGGGGGTSDPWINEIHYDNSSSDVGEGVEIAGAAGLDLFGYSLVAYNGNGGGNYKTQDLAGLLSDQDSGFGTLWFPIAGLQNGAPDGIALIDEQGTVLQFLSYEGSFSATSGPAAGMTSTDIGVSESGSTLVGDSLQLSGSGSGYADFAWQSPAVDTAGLPNTGQTFSGGGGGDTTPPDAPSALAETAGDAQVSLDWADNGEPDLAGYSIYRSTFSGGGYVLLNTTLSVNSDYLDTGLANGTTYYYVVTAQDATGNESILSSEVSATPSAPVAGTLWINEIHYDNSSGDKKEGVEIAGSAGTSLSGWTLVAYNGNGGGGAYKTVSLSGTLANQQAGFGTHWFSISGLQNGAPDGIALVDDQGAVVQFLSYEGTFNATDGAADGLTSKDIGVSETSSTNKGRSLQLGGSGSAYADFSWQSAQSHTRGSVNAGQTFGS